MLRYRCCFLAIDGSVNSRREYVAKDDREAVELARAAYQIYLESMGAQYGFELYRGAQKLVARELLPPSPAPPEPATAASFAV